MLGNFSIDHMVLTVKSIKDAKDFYVSVLGMKYEEFYADSTNELRSCLKFGSQKINLHQKDNLIYPGAKNPTTGSADICLISDVDIKEWLAIFKKFNIDIVNGPVNQVGAEKDLYSIYVRDPDLNLVEISNYK